MLQRLLPILAIPAAAIASGVLLALALPPHDIDYIAWFGFAPLLIASTRLRPLESVGLAILCSLSCAAVVAGWSSDYERLFWAYSPFFSFTVMAGIAAAAASALRLRYCGAAWVVVISCTAVALELGTTLLPIPFNLALTQYRNIGLIQVAALTGIWGVSLLLYLVNAAIADAVLTRRATPSLVIAAAAAFVVFGAGDLARRNVSNDGGEPLPVAAIQDYTGEETHGLAPEDSAAAWNGGDKEAMSRYAASHGAKLIVWSEEDLGSSFSPGDPKDDTRKLASSNHVAMVVSYASADQPKSFDSAAFVAPEGNVLGVYHKQHLYLGEFRTIQRGNGSPVYATPIGRIGMEICFDTCYTDVTRALAAGGAQLIAVPNYDPPTPRGVLHYLHSATFPFRAVENHISIVRCDSNGLSMLINPDGSIAAEGPLYRADVLMGAVRLGSGHGTIYTKLGDWVAYLCLGVVAPLVFSAVQTALTRVRNDA